MKHDDAFINPLEEQLEDAFPESSVLTIEEITRCNNEIPNLRTLSIRKFFQDFETLINAYNGGKLKNIAKLLSNLIDIPFDYQLLRNHVKEGIIPQKYDCISYYLVVIEFMNTQILESEFVHLKDKTMAIPNLEHFFIE